MAEKRQTARRRVYLAAASIINIRGEVGAGVRDWFGQFLSSFRVAHRVPPGIGLRELAQDIHAQSARMEASASLYLQTLVVMFYSSIVWRFLGLSQRQRFHVKNWPVWVGVTMLNVDALWREGGAAGPAPRLPARACRQVRWRRWWSRSRRPGARSRPAFPIAPPRSRKAVAERMAVRGRASV